MNISDVPFYDEFSRRKILNKGHFILSSGLHSEYYLQCSRIFEDANFAGTISSSIATLLPQSYDIVVAPAMGGLLFGYELSRILGVKNVFYERKNGVFELRRGFEIPVGSKILITEDVITTGKSIMEVYNLVTSFNPSSVHGVCIFDRTSHSALPFECTSLAKVEIQTYDPANLPPHLKDIPAIKPGSRNLDAK